MQGIQVWSLVRELRSHMLWEQLSLCDATIEPMCSKVHILWSPGTATRVCTLWSLCVTLQKPVLQWPLSFPSPHTFNLSQHQGLFQWVGSLHQAQSIGASASVSVVPMNIQGWFPLRFTGLISLQSKGLSRVFSSTTIWKHQFFGAQSSLQSNSYIHTWLLEKP